MIDCSVLSGESGLQLACAARPSTQSPPLPIPPLPNPLEGRATQASLQFITRQVSMVKHDSLRTQYLHKVVYFFFWKEQLSMALEMSEKATISLQLSGSVQAGHMWLFRSDFPSCSESAEIWHVYSFCVKKCPCFFQECRKIWTKLRQIPLLCPSPNNVGFRSLRAKTLCMCLIYAIGGWVGARRAGEGVDFQEQVWSLVSLA